MEIENFKIGDRKKDIFLLKIIIFLFIFVAWLLTPPGNKFMQVCFWGHNIQYFITRIVDKDATEEYKFYWRNAVYLTKMGDKKALTEMDRAIETIPRYFSEKEVKIIYKERAKMRCIFEDYKGALSDYLRVDAINTDDYLRIAFLLKKRGKPSLALSYCNKLFNIELAFDDACACVADIYANVGKYNSSIKVFDYLINKESDVAEHYIVRAYYKKLAGDIIGSERDIYMATKMDKSVDKNTPPIADVMSLKKVDLLDVF